MAVPITDVERAIALLAVEHEAIDPITAAVLIRQARSEPGRQLIDLLGATVPEDALLRGIAKSLQIRFFDMYAAHADFEFNDEVFGRADSNFLRRFTALPLVDKSNRVVVAVANPGDVEMIDYLRSRYQTFALVLSPRSQVQNKLAYYASADLDLPSLQSLPTVAAQLQAAPRDAAAKSPMMEWLDAVLNRAVSEGASDVHMLVQQDRSLLLRFRIDGVLRQQRVPPQIRTIEALGALLGRCETIDSANTREPQDGTFSFEAAGRQIDARVAMLPQSYGPTVVVRLLDSMNVRTRLDDMGFSVKHLQLMRLAMRHTQGCVVAVGPTGSGKSTTLYGLLREVNANEKNVLTVENPIEYRLPMIGQTEIRDGLGDRSLTFARSLRSILRLDPDVILVGEIRDMETAETAMQASVTGHLVLTTVHANSAVGVYPRLTNMGVPSYLAAESVSLVISQRLMRRVHDCAVLEAPTSDEIAALGTLGLSIPDRVKHAEGCGGCSGTGYRGRVAAVEVLAPSKSLKALATNAPREQDLHDLAVSEGFTSIRQDAYRHVSDGRTSVSEVLRVLSVDEASI